ncbi:transposase [Sphingobium yanoikuyae]
MRGERHPASDAAAFPAEDKIRIAFDGLHDGDSIAELCRKEGIAQSLYYTWLEGVHGRRQAPPGGDTARAATTSEVQDLCREARGLKKCVANLTLENQLLRKQDREWGRGRMRHPGGH